jgi:hypothetical protein
MSDHLSPSIQIVIAGMGYLAGRSSPLPCPSQHSQGAGTHVQHTIKTVGCNLQLIEDPDTAVDQMSLQCFVDEAWSGFI